MVYEIAVGVDGQLLQFNAASGELIERRPIPGTPFGIDWMPHLDAWVIAGSEGLQVVPAIAERG